MATKDDEYAKELQKHCEDKKTQDILIAYSIDSISHMLSCPALDATSIVKIIDGVLKSLVSSSGGKVGSASAVIEIDLPKMMEEAMKKAGSEKVSESVTKAVDEKVSEKPKTDPNLKRFNELMKSIVDKNKGKKTVKVTAEVKELVDTIEKYTGEVSVMKNIKTMMNRKPTEEGKILVVKKFIETVI